MSVKPTCVCLWLADGLPARLLTPSSFFLCDSFLLSLLCCLPFWSRIMYRTYRMWVPLPPPPTLFSVSIGKNSECILILIILKTLFLFPTISRYVKHQTNVPNVLLSLLNIHHSYCLHHPLHLSYVCLYMLYIMSMDMKWTVLYFHLYNPASYNKYRVSISSKSQFQIEHGSVFLAIDLYILHFSLVLVGHDVVEFVLFRKIDEYKAF